MAADPTCLVCGRGAPRETSEVIVLTDEEKAQLPEPLDEYVYCKPCWKVLSDPLSGPALMSGIAQHHFRLLGVSNAEELAARYRSLLTTRAVRKT